MSLPSISGVLPSAGALSRGDPRLRRLWLHLLLFLVTLTTTTWVGARLSADFQANRPAFTADPWVPISDGWRTLRTGLPFSLSLLAILLAHEFGHYWACARHRVAASLPYLLPEPLLVGTLGAFVRIRSPILNKRVLFDVGVAGPLAGFAVLLPLLLVGVMLSRAVPGIAEQGEWRFDTPLLLRALERALLPGTAPQDVSLHPVARAAWVGLLATAFNLLPIGQLDGGRLVYALAGEWHHRVSRLAVLLLVPLSLLYWPWLLWAATQLLVGMRHPLVYDAQPLGPGRRRLGLLAVAIFVVSFMPAPLIHEGWL